jgi:hypothetical protein
MVQIYTKVSLYLNAVLVLIEWYQNRFTFENAVHFLIEVISVPLLVCKNLSLHTEMRFNSWQIFNFNRLDLQPFRDLDSALKKLFEVKHVSDL